MNFDFYRFESTLAVLLMLDVLQIAAAWYDRHLTQAELKEDGIYNSWSAMEHGGLWADILVIPFMVAYVVGKYELDPLSARGFCSLAGIIVFVRVALELYRRKGITFEDWGDHCIHDKKIFPAGWLHGLFAVMAIWVMLQVYLGWTTPPVSKTDLLIFSGLLTPLFVLMIVKLSDRWVFDVFAKKQIAISIIGLWIITGIRLALMG
ncbi:hypothetical protein A3G63_01140 [Candidatus Kaiserbacteria bacterium RIFCSPLOWO2_12_FULL_52_8]|uniref:Uncharacterized protein n=1 Tax=Candidatus Kaiserbacteria bacterium RIFCSPHIGHO2_01_FULL_53_31 TaxID=1798481 RepID=A0A1F6CJA0_9BACT|nr:MAG: hypothetical protein A2678_01020 [Candidatus Kaiserbacteria bacterium RIFCSPHIGHO2_01_FULL_53_31]OGG94670.1 MAG: hypothetical protein A3G63_01140 [Candidatus Kaiserbacteria bacterium RIFCSPLOWO2_12_FULL_52_8]